MIELFKILNGYYDINVAPHLTINSTKHGHKSK